MDSPGVHSEPPDGDVAEVLRRWEAEEAALRRTMTAEGVPRPDQVAGLSGMEVFAKMFSGTLPYPPIGATLDFLPVQIEPGRAVFQGRPSLRHYNPLGTVHGGWMASLLDSCVGCAVHSTLPAGKGYTTAELKINYVRPVTTRVALVRATGTVIHVGARMATAEGRLVGPDGKLYAHASTTCFIFDAR
ncbi:MAG: PaaI family thioesterase [Pseudomonadota bacterium]|nr:PaaI family thioesterase [Pseudomonadota bacterium]